MQELQKKFPSGLPRLNPVKVCHKDPFLYISSYSSNVGRGSVINVKHHPYILNFLNLDEEAFCFSVLSVKNTYLKFFG